MKSTITIGVVPRTPRQSEKIYGYVLEAKGKTQMKISKASGTYHKVNLLALIEALRRYIRTSEIDIYIMDPYVADGIRNLERWQQSGFTSSKGKEIANAAEWKELQKELNKHTYVVRDEESPYTKTLIHSMEGQKNEYKNIKKKSKKE